MAVAPDTDQRAVIGQDAGDSRARVNEGIPSPFPHITRNEMNERPNPFDIPRHWTGEQALSVFEWLHALAYVLWDAYDDELLEAIDARQLTDEHQLDLPF